MGRCAILFAKPVLLILRLAGRSRHIVMSSERCFCGIVLLVEAVGPPKGSLQPAAEVLQSFGISTEMATLTVEEPVETKFAKLSAIIVASPDASLPAALAARTAQPVIRVPTEAGERSGLALLDDGSGNLPAGPPHGVFATMAIGRAGAKNAALFVVSLLICQDPRLRAAWEDYRTRQTDAVLRHPPLTMES